MEEANVIKQDELTTISIDEELKQKFYQGYQKLWLQRNIETRYPASWNIAEVRFTHLTNRKVFKFVSILFQ